MRICSSISARPRNWIGFLTYSTIVMELLNSSAFKKGVLHSHAPFFQSCLALMYADSNYVAFFGLLARVMAIIRPFNSSQHCHSQHTKETQETIIGVNPSPIPQATHSKVKEDLFQFPPISFTEVQKSIASLYCQTKMGILGLY